MEVRFKTKKIKRQCENPHIAQRDYGANIGNRLTQRIREFTAAKSLIDIKCIPSARIHSLQGNMAKFYAVDLVHPFRLIVKPILEFEGNINKLELISIIVVEEVVDYHGKI